MKLIAAPDKFCVWKRELMNVIPFTKTNKNRHSGYFQWVGYEASSLNRLY